MFRMIAMFLILGTCRLSAATPTNFIQILTDDQGWGDLACYGHKRLKTP